MFTKPVRTLDTKNMKSPQYFELRIRENVNIWLLIIQTTRSSLKFFSLNKTRPTKIIDIKTNPHKVDAVPILKNDENIH